MVFRREFNEETENYKWHCPGYPDLEQEIQNFGQEDESYKEVQRKNPLHCINMIIQSLRDDSEGFYTSDKIQEYLDRDLSKNIQYGNPAKYFQVLKVMAKINCNQVYKVQRIEKNRDQ